MSEEELAIKSGKERISELKSLRATSKGCISRIKTFIESKSETLTEAELECRLEILDAYFKQILAHQSEIERLKCDESEEKIRSDIEDLYCATKSKILTLLSGYRRVSFAQSLNSTEASNASFSVAHTPTHNLPKLKLPHFTGKYTEYTQFMRTFDTLVNKDVSLSTIEKFNHLLSCVSGPALRTIKPLEVTEENYRKALDCLKDRFDNKSLIFQQHVSELFELPRIEKNSAEQLRSLLDNVRAHFTALETLGSYKSIANALIIHLVSTKLDPESQAKWDEAIDYAKLPAWEDYERVLSRRCQYLEAREVKQAENSSTVHLHQRNQRRQMSTQKCNLTSLAAIQPVCRFCNAKGHSIYNCPKFVELSVTDRYNEVKKISLCINCLAKGHSVKKCPSSKCRVCSFPHHTLLHRYSSQSTDRNNQPSIKTGNGNEFFVQAKQLPSALVSSLSNADSLIDESHTFLATAVVKIKDRTGRYHPARVLLDSASQVNFITNDMVQTLQLAREKISTTVSGIGDVNAKIKYQTQATISSRINGFEAELDFWILPRITEMQPEKKIDIQDWSIPSNIQLADPMFFKPQKIDLLIGADLFFQLLCSGQINIRKGLPILQKTLFGWTVSGRYKRLGDNASRAT